MATYKKPKTDECFSLKRLLVVRAGLSWFATLMGISALFIFSTANADYQQRFSLGVGIVSISNPSQTSFALSGEYEYRLNRIVGMGLAGNYIFSTPSIGLIALPTFFVHPLAGDWFLSAAPLIELVSGSGTYYGVRLGTRIPLPIGPVTLIPSLAVDFINGGQDYIMGLGLQL